MFRITRTLFAFLLVTFAVTLFQPSTVEASVAVQSAGEVSRTKIAGTGSEYLFEYILTINNDGPALDNVKVYVSCTDPAVTMLDDVVAQHDADGLAADPVVVGLASDVVRDPPVGPELAVEVVDEGLHQL